MYVLNVMAANVDTSATRLLTTNHFVSLSIYAYVQLNIFLFQIFELSMNKLLNRNYISKINLDLEIYL